MAGSYYVEYLTTRIENEVEKYLNRIDKMGGALIAIEKGYFQDEIRQNAYNLKREIDNGERVIVGVNKFKDVHDIEPKLNTMDTEIEMRQVNKLKDFKEMRDRTKVNAAIERLQKAAEKQEENLMPHIISSVKDHVTLGEISTTFETIFGRYEPKFSF